MNATFHVDNKQTCDHLLEASINIIKYRNDPHGGCIGPHISPYIHSRNIGNSLSILTGDGLVINFPREQAVHGNVLV